jgi:hypothetical protein
VACKKVKRTYNSGHRDGITGLFDNAVSVSEVKQISAGWKDKN